MGLQGSWGGGVAARFLWLLKPGGRNGKKEDPLKATGGEQGREGGGEC